MQVQTLLGIKKDMSSTFTGWGHRVPVTAVVAEPNVVISTSESKILVGIGKNKKSKKTENAIIKTVGYTPKFIKEIKTLTPQASTEDTQAQDKKITAGNKITVSIFEVGDEVKVTGTTKGKGFAGGVKRHGFAGGPKTHGQSDRHRAPGSIGAGTTPGRVYKGKRMAGHMGAVKVTTTGLEVIEVDEAKNTILIKGAIPGAKNGFVIIEKTGKVKGYVAPAPPPEQEEPEEEDKVAKAEEAEKDAKNADAKDESKEEKIENTEPAEQVKEKEAEDAK